MSTRSRIAILNDDGTTTSIYCHNDGYPRWAGRILRDSYKTTHKIRRLIALGDISVIAKNIGKRHDFDWRYHIKRDFVGEWEALTSEQQAEYTDTAGNPNRHLYEKSEIEKYPENDMVRAYGRDRDETNVDALESTSVAVLVDFFRLSDQEWLYLWKDGEWLVTDDGVVWAKLENLDWGDEPFRERDANLGYEDATKPGANPSANPQAVIARCRVRTRKITLDA